MMRIEPSNLFHPMLLRTLVAVADERSFSKAAVRLNALQPTVSHHIARLEDVVGQKLLNRTTRHIQLTQAGENLLPLARSILASYEVAHRAMTLDVLRGRVRLGASEDFALAGLPAALRAFRQGHEQVELTVTIASPLELEDRLAEGELDLAILEAVAGEREGHLLRRGTPEWFALPEFGPAADGKLPIILSTPPRRMREMAIAALDEAGLAWREVCTASGSLGLRAAALAGLGAALQIRSESSPLQRVPASFGLPSLPDIDLMLVVASDAPAVTELSRQIIGTPQTFPDLRSS